MTYIPRRLRRGTGPRVVLRYTGPACPLPHEVVEQVKRNWRRTRDVAVIDRDWEVVRVR